MEDIIKEIRTETAPAPIGAYSQAVKAGDLVFVSGQIPLTPETGEIFTGDIKKQTLIAIENVENILKAVNSGLDQVVKVEIFLNDMSDFNNVNEVYASKFNSPVKPARAVLEVSRLPKDAGIEISCVAYSPD